MDNTNQPLNQIEELLPLYALGGLNAAEAAQVEAALKQQPALRAEVERLSDAAALLAESVSEMTPPPQVRTAVLGHIRPAERPQRSASPRVISAAPPKKPSFWRRFRILPALASVTVVVILAFMSLQLFNLQRDMRAIQAQNQALADSLVSQGWLVSYLVDENVERFEIAGTDQAPDANGQFLLRADGSQGLLVISDLKALSEEQTYQFWMIDADAAGPVSAGLFDIGTDGTGLLRVDLAGSVDDFEAIGVSIEPAGGSAAPSDEIVMLAELN